MLAVIYFQTECIPAWRFCFGWMKQQTRNNKQAAGGNNLISVVVVHDHLHKSFWWLWEEQVQFHPSPLSK